MSLRFRADWIEVDWRRAVKRFLWKAKEVPSP